MKIDFSFNEFFFSHHRPENYDRCYFINLFGKKVHICARCLGLYPLALISFVMYFFLSLPEIWNLYLLYLFPIPAFVDWGLHRFDIFHGFNPTRTITGALMGSTYGRIGYNLINNPFKIHTPLVIILYVSLAFTILFLSLNFAE